VWLVRVACCRFQVNRTVQVVDDGGAMAMRSIAMPKCRICSCGDRFRLFPAQIGNEAGDTIRADDFTPFVAIEYHGFEHSRRTGFPAHRGKAPRQFRRLPFPSMSSLDAWRWGSCHIADRCPGSPAKRHPVGVDGMVYEVVCASTNDAKVAVSH
jgi:hypothetical protein